MTTSSSDERATPFHERSLEDQARVSNDLFDSLYTLLTENRPGEISDLRLKLLKEEGMDQWTFQDHLENMYNQQTHIFTDEDTKVESASNFFLTTIPVTFFPDHDIEADVIIQSTLGVTHGSWAQEIVATGINHGFFRAVDRHYVIPAFFDIHELFDNPTNAFNIIGDVVSLNLPEKYPLKNIVLTKEAPCKTMHFIIVTATDDIDERCSILPGQREIFSEFSDMRQTMESIINHYYTSYSKNEFSGCVIVGPPLQGSLGSRLKYPCTMMGHLSFNLLKISHALELEKTSVVIERNISENSYMINVYCYNRCLLSYKYPETVLAKGLEEEMFTYILDTNGFSNHRIIDVNKHSDTSEKIKETLIRVVK